jgi:hypothetical protein
LEPGPPPPPSKQAEDTLTLNALPDGKLATEVNDVGDPHGVPEARGDERGRELEARGGVERRGKRGEEAEAEAAAGGGQRADGADEGAGTRAVV